MKISKTNDKNIYILLISLLVLFLSIIVEGTVNASSDMLNKSFMSMDNNQSLLSTINFNTTELYSISAFDNLRYQIAKIFLKYYGMHLGFEDGDINNFWNWIGAEFDRSDTNRPHFEVITDSPKEGTKALKFIVHPDDVSNNGARTEVVHYSSNDLTKPILFEDDEEMWFHWYTRIPDDTQITDTWHIFTQWHQFPEFSGTGCPAGVTSQWCNPVPLGFNFKNSTRDGGLVFELNVLNHTDANPDGFDNVWRDNFIKGKWYEFLLHVIWSNCNTFRADGKCIDNENNGTKNNGLIELWVDGDKKHSIPNRYTLDTDNETPLKVYLKQGLYHDIQNDSQITWIQTIDHDGMEYLSCKTNFSFKWLVC